jgi:hypothetical protein
VPSPSGLRQKITSFVLPLRRQQREKTASLIENYLTQISTLRPLTAREFCDGLFVHQSRVPLDDRAYRRHCIDILVHLLGVSPRTIADHWGSSFENMPINHGYLLGLHRWAVQLLARTEKLEQENEFLKTENRLLRQRMLKR